MWPPRGSYEPASGPLERPPVDGDMCEDEAPAAPLEEERGESSSHGQRLEEEESDGHVIC